MTNTPSPLPYDPTRPPRTSVLAVLSPFLAALGIPLNYFCCIGLPLAFVALFFALLPLYQMKKDPTLRGKPWAIAGLILVALNLAFAAVIGIEIALHLKDLH